MSSEDHNRIFAEEVMTNVQESWATIKSDLQKIGLEIFKRLFVAYPQYQQLFKAFKDVPTDQLENNEFYKKHALSVANALNSAIENLKNPEELVSILKAVGANHVKRNVTQEHYENAKSIIVESIIFFLGDVATDRMITYWTDVLNIAVSVIKKGNEEEEAKYL